MPQLLQSLPGSGTQGEIPLVLGIVGHRDLCPEQIPAIEKLLRQLFQDLRSKYPQTPLVLLSALAEGADCLAARVALDCGAQLVVPLPMPIVLYQRDFG